MKLCKDCKHAVSIREALGTKVQVCAAGPREPVFGVPTRTCRYERMPGSDCGPHAVKFEPKVSWFDRWSPL